MGYMYPPCTSLEDRDNLLEKVEAKIDICPFGTNLPWIPLGHLGWKD